MIWHRTRKVLGIAWLIAGLLAGILYSFRPTQFQPDWTALTLMIGLMLLLFPIFICLVFRWQIFLGVKLKLTEPSGNGPFLSPTKPLEFLHLAAEMCLWYGLGAVAVFWIAWPWNIFIAALMVLSHVSIHAATRLAVWMGRELAQQNAG